MSPPVLVVGFGVTGRAVARALLARGETVVAVDDRPSEDAVTAAADLGVALTAGPGPADLERLVDGAVLVVPSPGVPAGHAVFAVAAHAGVPVRSEIELASDWSSAPLVAVTGTNGKTTVTTLIQSMLEASGLRAVAAGNIGLPLIEAVAQPADVLVAEVSSFQLHFTERFRPHVAVWLNLGADHMDWHGTLDAYAADKARIWAAQEAGDVAIVNADDPAVTAWAETAPGRVVTFGLAPGEGYRAKEGSLLLPGGDELVAEKELWRALPHDVANALAAAAAALEAGASLDGVRQALRAFRGLPHRVELVGEAGGVRYYDDSKATDPHAVHAALGGFDSVVLIAGGRNKGLDLGTLADRADHVRAVVAIGEAGPEVVRAFEGVRPVVEAASMDEAVESAQALARPGDVVLLSPGCASFDWYRSYAERGDDFARAVRRLGSRR